MKAVASVLERFNNHEEAMSSTQVLSAMLLELTTSVRDVDSSKFSAGQTLNSERERTSKN